MDEADLSDDLIEAARSDAISEIARKVAAMQPGNPGECDKCGEERPRLVNGWCCRCRDRYKMKYH